MFRSYFLIRKTNVSIGGISVYDTYLLIVLSCLSIATIKFGVGTEDTLVAALGIAATLITICMIGGELHYRYETRPKRKKKKPQRRISNKVIALIILELLVGLAISILTVNGVKVSPTIIIAATIVAAIASLLF